MSTKNNRGLYFLVIFLSIVEIFLLGDANALLDCFADARNDGEQTPRNDGKGLKKLSDGKSAESFYYYFISISGGIAGKSTQKHEPLLCSLSTPKSNEWLSRMAFTIFKPKPVPLTGRVWFSFTL